MICRDTMDHLAYQTTHQMAARFPHATPKRIKNFTISHNILITVLHLIPLVNTVYGCVMLAIQERGRRWRPISERIPKIIVYSLCIASLGILLLPLMIIGLIRNINEQRRNQDPSLTNRNVKEIHNDWLL